MPRAQRTTIPFVGAESRSKVIRVDVQQTRNFVASRRAAGAKAPVVLESAPGLAEFGSVGDGACRSPQFVVWRHPVDGTRDTYAVFGSNVVRISQAAGPVVVGSLGTATGIVRIARGRAFLMFVDGQRGYTYDGTTFAEISDLDFPDIDLGAAPTHVVYLDGYFIVNDANSDFWSISAIEDPTSWNALDFEAAAVAPDNALGIAATESRLWLIGDETAQAFYNSGNALFPFTVDLAATQEVGIAAAQTIAESDAGVFYLATTPEGGEFVYAISGQSGTRISTEEIEEQIAEVTDISNAYGFVYQQAGKSFYVLQLAPDAPTLVYNVTVGTWESRALSDDSAWRIAGMGVLEESGRRINVGGSRFGPILYVVDLDNYQDAGKPLVRRRVTQIQHQNNHLIDWWEVVVDADVRDVPADGVGSDPKMRLRYSDDGGNSWSSQLIEPLGRTGEKFRRAVFRNLGFSRNRLFEVEVSDPVGITLIAAYARVGVRED